MSDTIGGLAYFLTANNDDFNRKFRQSQGVGLQMQRVADGLTTRIATLGKTMIAAAGVAGTGAFIKAQFSAIDALAKTSRRLGDTTENISRLQFANEQAGISVAETTTIMQAFERRLGETARGTGEAIEAYRALGLNAQSLARQSPVEAFRMTVAALGRVTDEFQRASIAQDLYGRSGAAIIQAIGNLTTGWNELAKQADDAGRSVGIEFAEQVEAANDAVNRMHTALKGVGTQLTITLAPVVEKTANTFTAITQAGGAFLRVANEATGGVAKLVIQVSAAAVVIAGAGAATVYLAKRSIELTLSIAKQTKDWIANTIAVQANTTAKLANASVPAGGVATGLSGGQAARLAELRGTEVAKFRAAEQAQLASGTAIGLLAQPNPLVARALAANTAAMAKATSGAGLLTRALTGLQAAALPLTIAITAGGVAIRNFYTWATEGSEAFDGLGRVLLKIKSFITGTDELGNAEIRAAESQREHNEAIAAYEKKQADAAAAIDRTTKALQAQKKAAGEAAGRFRATIDPLVEKLYEAEGETERQRTLRKVREQTPIGPTYRAEVERQSAEVNRLFDVIESTEAARERMEKFKSAVVDVQQQLTEAQARVANFGKTSGQLLIEEMEAALQRAVELGNVSDQIGLGKYLTDLKSAQRELDRLTKAEKVRQRDFDHARGLFADLDSLRQRMSEAGRGFRPGAVQRGSLAEYEQRRSVDNSQRELLSLQRQANRINDRIAALIQAGNVDTKRLADAVASDRQQRLP